MRPWLDAFTWREPEKRSQKVCGGDGSKKQHSESLSVPQAAPCVRKFGVQIPPASDFSAPCYCVPTGTLRGA